MSEVEIRLDWFRDKSGYSIVDRGVYGERIVDNGGLLVATKPLNTKLAFNVFARVSSAQELLIFVKRFGLLGFPAYERDVPGFGTSFGPSIFKTNDDVPRQPTIDLEGESVADHLDAARLFQAILVQSSKGWKRGNVSGKLEQAITDALHGAKLGTVTLTGDRRWGLRPALSASSLMDGLWLQLASHIGEGAEYRVCELHSCGKLFSVGPKADRRADARFCCPKHQIDDNSRRRTSSKGPR